MRRSGRTVRERERRTGGFLMLALVWRHLMKHRFRTAMTVLGVALGVAVAVAVQLANQTALSAFAATTAAIAGPAAWQVVLPGGDLPESALPRLRPLADVAAIVPLLEAPCVIADKHGEGLRLIGTDLLQPFAFRGYADQSPVDPALGWPNGVWLTDTAANTLMVKPDDVLAVTIHDRRADLRVAGVLPPSHDTAALDPWVAFMDVAALQELAHRQGSLDRLDLIPRPGVEAADVQAAAKGLVLPPLTLLDPAEQTRTAGRMLGAFRLNMMALSFVALIVGAYLIYNAVAMSVVQRRRDIAVMRSLGALKRQIFGIFALEALLVAVIGGAIGVGLGAAMARLAVGAVGQTVDALYVDTPLTAVLWTSEPFAIGVGAGLLLALVAALAPAAEAAGTPPAHAMRAGTWESKQRGRVWPWALVGGALLTGAWWVAGQPPTGGMPWNGYAAASLLILGCSFFSPLVVVGVAAIASLLARLLQLPMPATLGARNFRQAVGRNGVAVSALMVGAAMTIGVATMVASFRTTVADWVEATMPGSFYIAAPSSGASAIATIDPAIAGRVAVVPGVAAVERFRKRMLPYDGVMIHLGAADVDVLSQYGRLVLRDKSDPKALYASLAGRDRVLVSEALAIKHGAKVGGTVALPTPVGARPFTIMGVYRDYTSDQGYVLMDRVVYQRYWQDDAVTDVAVYAKPDADLAAIRVALRQALGQSPAVITSAAELRASVMRVFDQTFAITYALHIVAITVSVLGVASTLAALVLERGRELAILRQVGLLRAQIQRMVLVEAGLLGLSGGLLGIVAGGLLAVLLIEVINRQSFGWTVDLQVPWSFIAATIGVLIMAAMLAGWLPARRAAALPIVDGLRHD